jgi:hypothetical protein
MRWKKRVAIRRQGRGVRWEVRVTNIGDRRVE